MKKNAGVAELVDAHDSGSCVRKDVEVRVFSSAPILSISYKIRGYKNSKNNYAITMQVRSKKCPRRPQTQPS